MNKGIDLSKVDISGPWHPGAVGISLYGEAKRCLIKEARWKPSLESWKGLNAKYFGYIDKACSVTDVAIYKMMNF